MASGFSTAFDTDLLDVCPFQTFTMPKDLGSLPEALSAQELGQIIEPEVRELIAQTQAKFHNLILQISLCYSNPREVRVKRLKELKETVLVTKAGRLVVAPPCIRIAPTDSKLNSKTRHACDRISDEVERGWEQLRERKTGWFHLYCFFSNYQLSGLRVAHDMKVF